VGPVKAWVLETSDVDCDGISYGYHFFVGEHGTEEEAVAYEHARGRSAYGFDINSGAMPLTTFFSRFKLSGFDLDYFLREGYFSTLYLRPGV